MNPGSVLVNTSSVATEQMIQNTLENISKLPPPPYAGQVATDPSCTSAVITYTGEPKGSLSVGDVLFINTYKLTVRRSGADPGERRGGTFSGQGIVAFPYLNNALMAVNFSGISVVGNTTQAGGCVTAGM